MNESAKPSQKDDDERAQRRLTTSVGHRLERQEKSASSPLSRVKRLLRIG